MPINEKFFTVVMGHLKDLESEVTALTATLLAVRKLEVVSDLDATLATARLWANQQMDAKYDDVVGRAILEMRKRNDDEALIGVLSKLAPPKYVN
jgi:hypothetical protein